MSIVIGPRVVIGRARLPLRYASLCLNDETVFDLRDRACPACGSRTLVLLARWLRERVGER